MRDYESVQRTRVAPQSETSRHDDRRQQPEAVPATVVDTLSDPSPGRPLDAGEQRLLEHGFGHSLAGVRIHADEGAYAVTRTVDASAATSGSDIYFRSGAYDPSSMDGQQMLAHEAAHVRQQSGRQVTGAPRPDEITLSHPGDPQEQAAKRDADAVVGGGRVRAMPSTAFAVPQTLQVQRAADDEDSQQVVESWSSAGGALMGSAISVADSSTAGAAEAVLGGGGESGPASADGARRGGQDADGVVGSIAALAAMAASGGNGAMPDLSSPSPSTDAPQAGDQKEPSVALNYLHENWNQTDPGSRDPHPRSKGGILDRWLDLDPDTTFTDTAVDQWFGPQGVMTPNPGESTGTSVAREMWRAIFGMPVFAGEIAWAHLFDLINYDPTTPFDEPREHKFIKGNDLPPDRGVRQG